MRFLVGVFIKCARFLFYSQGGNSVNDVYEDLLVKSMRFVKDRYIKIVKINFSDETFVPIVLDEYTRQCPKAKQIKTITQWFDCFINCCKIHTDDIEKFKNFANVKKMREWIRNSDDPIYCSYRRKFGADGDYKYVAVSLIRDKEYSGEYETAYLFVKNIHELYQQEYDAIIEEIGIIDKQTGLLNRTAYERDIQKYTNINIGVVFIDINGLKHINDTKGHSAGDKIISDVAKLLQHAFPDFRAYHVSGDEFIVISFDADLRQFLQRVMSWHRWLWRQEDFPLASVGYSLDTNVKNITDIVEEAEKAMYIDKEIFYERYPEYKR